MIAHPHRVESHHDAMNATLRQHRFHGDLMASARQASLPGAQAHTVKGDASISVDCQFFGFKPPSSDGKRLYTKSR